MKIRFIINPIAGTGKQKGIENYISNHFNDYEIFYTKKIGHASIISKEAVKNKINIVVAIGGDGTLNECMKSLVNTETALGVVPCGSGNGFANHIGMKNNIKEAIKQIKYSKIISIDSCTINDLPFVNVAGIGFDAHIAKLFSKSKKRGFLKYMKLILKELMYNPQEYNISYNTNKKKINAYMISIANASEYGNNIKIAPMANIQDGLIDFVIVKKFPKWEIPFFLYKSYQGKTFMSKHVDIIQTNKMQILAENTLIHLDGEPYKTTNPITINLLKNSLKILKPNEK
tara:strand:- start:379 stop:1239 length:861 start_codon:yes stop_codon:yes gene_type:complete